MTIILGTVTKADGSGVSDASVYVVSSPGKRPDVAQLTDEAGRFVAAAPGPGRYVIGARSPDGAWGEVELVVTSEATVDVEVRIE